MHASLRLYELVANQGLMKDRQRESMDVSKRKTATIASPTICVTVIHTFNEFAHFSMIHCNVQYSCRHRLAQARPTGVLGFSGL